LRILDKPINLIFMIILLWIILTAGLSAQEAMIKNDKYSIAFNIIDGRWNCNTINGDNIINNAEFLIITEDGKKYYSSSAAYERSAQKAAVNGVMGSGEKLTVRFVPEKNEMPEALISFCLYNDKSYLSIEVEAINAGQDKIIIKEIQPITLSGARRSSLIFNGSLKNVACLMDGSSPGDECKLKFFREEKELSGFSTTVLYNLETKKSLILGALRHDKAVNPIAIRLQEENSDFCSIDLTLSSYFVYCPLKPAESLSTGRILIDLPENVFEGLEKYAEIVASINNIALDHRPMCGWCSWYYIYADITEDEIIKNTNFLAENLKAYGLEYIQVDRGRILTGTDWLTSNKKFPHDMKWLAEKIHDKGFKAGIWTSPFWLGRDSEVYNEKWILDKISTEPKQEEKRRRHWASWGDVLDASNGEVINYIKNFVDVLVNDWDYDYLKNDFLKYGLPEISDLDKVLLEKGEIKDVIKFPRKNLDITPFEAYKNGLKAIKETAGDETFIMGCNAILMNTAGLAHACRVGGDIQSKLCVTWECGTSKTVRTSAKRYYYNGRTMWIDPDCLVIWDPCGRGPFTLEQARVRAALASFFGGMMMTSDRMYDLPPERVDLLKRIIPPYPETARPLDLFEKDMPEIWLWDIKKDFGNWHVVGVFNYDQKTVTREISYEYLGLDSSKEYILYDFWKKRMPTRSSRYYYRTLMPFKNEMFLELAPMSCMVIAFHEKLARPQLISTNRHITQGAIDIKDVKWDEAKKELSGISELVRDDDYELVLTLPEDMEFVKAQVSDEDVSCHAFLDDPDVDRYNTVKVKLKSPEHKEVRWCVSYK
jgi:hypothetical protein